MGKLFDEVKNNSSNYKDWLKYYSKKGQETRIAEAENAGLNATQFGILFGGKGTIPDRIDTIIENMKEDQAARILDNVLNLPKGDGIKYSNMTYYEDKEFKAFSDSLKKITGYEESRANIQTLRDTVINNAINTTRNGFAPRMMLKNLIGSAGKYDDKVESATIGLVKDYIERRKQILEAKKDIEVACKLMKEHSLPPIIIIELIYCHRDKYPFTDVNLLERLLGPSKITLYELFQNKEVKEFLKGQNRGVRLISLYTAIQNPPQKQQIPASIPVAPAAQPQQIPAGAVVSATVVQPSQSAAQLNLLPPIIAQHNYSPSLTNAPLRQKPDNQQHLGNLLKINKLVNKISQLINKSDINPFLKSYRDKRRVLQELKDLLQLNLLLNGAKFPPEKARALQGEQRLKDLHKEIFANLAKKGMTTFTLYQFINEWLEMAVSKSDEFKPNSSIKTKQCSEDLNSDILSVSQQVLSSGSSKSENKINSNKDILYAHRFFNKKTETQKSIEDINSEFGSISMTNN